MFPDTERFHWFEAHTRRILIKCERTANSAPGYSPGPVTVYVPGGDDKYPSFWVRDAVMECASGLVEAPTMKGMLAIILANQNGPEPVELLNGLRIDPWAVPDHINLPGVTTRGGVELEPGAVFYPGTFSPGPDQGDGSYGLRAADDDIYEVIELAELIFDVLPAGEQGTFLQESRDGVSVIERLHRGFQAMVVDEATGLCWNEPGDWAAANFHDALRPMGAVALTSVLRFRGARSMARFYRQLGDTELAAAYDRTSEQLRDSARSRLLRDDGWLMMGTVVDRQPDLWATSRAVYIGLLTGEQAGRACQVMLRAVEEGTISASGYLRHTPTTADAVPGRHVWEHDVDVGRGRYGIYQSGGYWPQPLGYVCYALAQVDESVARRLATEFIDHTKTHVEQGAPFEWINPAFPLEKTPSLGRWYGPSATLPLQAFRRLSTPA